MNATLLAVLCSKVAEHPSVDAPTKEKARSLKAEWAALQTTPLSGEKKKHDEKVAENHKRMVEFLKELLEKA